MPTNIMPTNKEIEERVRHVMGIINAMPDTMQEYAALRALHFTEDMQELRRMGLLKDQDGPRKSA